MNEALKKWLKHNPPKVELTEFEKNIRLEDIDPKKHSVYLEEIDDMAIYRLRQVSALERMKWTVLGTRANDGSIDYFVSLWKSLGFCPLGYDFTDLHEMNNMFGSDFQSIF